MVCPNDTLLFTCAVTGSSVDRAIVTLPSGEEVAIRDDNTTIGEEDLPDGVTVYDHSAVMNSGVTDYTLVLAIDSASLLNDSMIECSSLTSLTDEAACPVATGKTTLLLGFYGKHMQVFSPMYKHAILIMVTVWA